MSKLLNEEEGKDIPADFPRNQTQRAERQSAPRKRQGFGSRQQKLWVDPSTLDPDYYYYWFRDEPGRIEFALSIGYEYVDRKAVSLLPGVVQANDSVGSQVSIVAGRHEDHSVCHQFLMRIPMEFHQEMYEEEQSYNDKVDEAILSGVVSQGDRQDAFYVPRGQQGGISMKSKVHR